MTTLFKLVWAFIAESKMIKTSAASAIGSGAVVIGLVEAKMHEIKELAAKDKAEIIQYVDHRHDRAMDRIEFMLETQIEMKQTLKTMDDRLYYINKKIKE